jgi:hypothetical protein
MDDARMERLLAKPATPPPRPPKRTGFDVADSVYDDADGPTAYDLLRTRPQPKVPRARLHTPPLSDAGNPLPAHGTATRYKHHRCRCESCTKAARKAEREWQRANPEKKREANRQARARKRAETQAA